MVFLLLLAMTVSLSAQKTSIPLHFERNLGQTGPAVKYLARDSSVVRMFEEHDVIWQSGKAGEALMHMAFQNPGRSAVLEGLDALSGKANYVFGSDLRSWIRDVDCYSRIRYRDIFPGVDVDFRDSSGALEYDIVLQPGADPRRVRFLFSGAKSARLTDSGDLVFETSAGPVRHHAPVSWQTIRGQRRPVTARFALSRRGPDTEVGFSVDSWDHTMPLTIDPVISYDQTVGASGRINGLTGIRVDGQGNVYVAGLTSSPDLPVTSGPPRIQWFAAKLNADGSGFAYVTYLAPGSINGISSLAIDSAGNAWMAGGTSSSTFPVTQNAIQKILNGGRCVVSGNPNADTCSDGFIFGLNPAGDAPAYGTFLGGTGTDSITGIRISADGTIWATGITSSADFPVTSSAVQSKLNGPQDVFLAHIDPRTPSLLYATYFGGSGHETAAGIALDQQGGVYIGGATDSTDFPVSINALQAVYGGGTDVFFAKFGGADAKPVFASFWGGVNGDLLNAIEADSGGNLYLAVDTSQAPISLGSGGIFVNNPRASLMKIDPAGRSVVWSNHSLETVSAMTVDSQGRLSATGRAFVNRPLTPNALNTCPGPGGSYLVRLDADGKTLLYGSGVAGSNLAVDASGSVYLAGGTLIEKQDFSQDPAMAATCILGATQYYGDAVAPGEIISIYGRNIGPAQGVIGAFDSSGRLPFSLGGVTVTFDGAPAPLLYVQAGQINAIVPFKVAGQKTALAEIALNGVSAPVVRVPLRDASNIAVTTTAGLIAAINEDGTINSNAHPARAGTIVAIYSSGGGQTNPPSMDGEITRAALPLVLPVKVLVGSGPSPLAADVLYAGSAPGLIAGTVQINFRVPLNLPASIIGAGYPNQNVAIVIGGDQTSYSTTGSIFVQ
ncbi:MAG: hypothetical protein QOJ99_2590 [Bryobacterales bacterium]|nr:hypothetical protein [Bryobacterales bacterium]